MGLLDIFKKKKEPLRQIRFEELGQYLLGLEKDLTAKEQGLVINIKEKLKSFINSLDEKKKDLETLDLSEKKIEDKILFIVKENLDHYIYCVYRLINNLNNLESNGLRSLIDKLNSNLYDFEKRSSLSFQKATFLIGKELGSIKDEVDAFFDYLKVLLNDNKDYFDKKNAYDELDKLLKNLSKDNGFIKESSDNIKKLEHDIRSSEYVIQDLKLKINNLIESKEYQSENEYNQSLYNKFKDYNDSLYSLKQKIDFKYLTSLYHTSPQKLRLIDKFKDNFKEGFMQNSLEFLEILESSKIDSNMIQEFNDMIKQNNSLKEENIRTEIKDKINSLESEIKRQILKITDLNSSVSTENKKIDRLNEKIISDKSMIKDKLSLLSLELIDS